MKHQAPVHASSSELVRTQKVLRILGFVVALNAVTLVAEIGTGLAVNSVALTADGLHMLGHTIALGLSFFVIGALDRSRVANASLGAATPALLRIERVAGLANAALLVLLGACTLYAAVNAFARPPLRTERDLVIALGVAGAGLLVNVTGGWLLRDSRGQGLGHGLGDGLGQGTAAEHGISLTLLSDAFLSILAIIALCAGLFAGWESVDRAVGVFGGLVILTWGASLLTRGLRT